MIDTLPIAYIAVACYCIAAVLELLTPANSEKHTATKLLGALGAMSHFIVLVISIHSAGGVSGSFFDALSITSFIVVLVTYINQIQMGNSLLLAPVFTFSALCVFLAALFGHYVPIQTTSHGIFIHVFSSITAYALLCLASLQALIVYAIDNSLKRKRRLLFAAKLPSLQGMETQLFRLISTGLIALSIAIASGVIFIDDLFSQHLLHKTVFTLISWLLLVALLAGRKIAGWRGTTAAHWTLGAFFVLVIAYLGSKFVLDLVLHRI